MSRVVLVGSPDGQWKLYRQPQWMAEVRRSPEITAFPRRHFDIEESAISQALDDWEPEGAGSSPEVALGLLHRHGASELSPP